MRAPAPKEPVQGARGCRNMCAPACQETVQRLWWWWVERLRAPAHAGAMNASASTSACGLSARSATPRMSASTIAKGAGVKNAGDKVSVNISDKGAGAKSVGA